MQIFVNGKEVLYIPALKKIDLKKLATKWSKKAKGDLKLFWLNVKKQNIGGNYDSNKN